MRESILYTLEDEGYNVDAFPSAEKGLEQLESKTYDLIITDVFLGSGRDGVELTGQIKSSHPSIKIIAITGGGSSKMLDVASLAQEYGADRVLLKQFSPERLLTAVREVLSSA